MFAPYQDKTDQNDVEYLSETWVINLAYLVVWGCWYPLHEIKWGDACHCLSKNSLNPSPQGSGCF